ncbi:PREDICTED: uncharacterized protein LOC108765723 [Trachymyrmex cornetzi]|uniref:uncharacterized protein LOC108765723 n=1 Tax=Trachymyrmex cornetzi TaxID=471704 RepID=UPI00084F1231|nr:PREDICTED: uncharacterized protein LOC108765723 [Trachymyrmex cornetzi]
MTGTVIHWPYRTSRHSSTTHLISDVSDPGSELSFVTEELAHSLRRKTAIILLLGIGGTHSGRTRGVVYMKLYSTFNDFDSFVLQAFILPRLTFEIPSFEVTRDSWAHLSNLQLADPQFNKPGPIHIIIGADAYGQIIKPEIIKGDSSSPVTQLTLFGWAVSDPFGPVTLNPDDADCEEHFRSTFSWDQTGRYIVRLPLKSPAIALGDSSSTALRCLSRLQKRLACDPSYCKLYTDFLQEYQSLGHMVPVLESKANGSPVFYLPHHGVLREDSQST